MNYSTFCLQSHQYPSDGAFPGTCFYNNTNDWYNLNTEVEQKVKFTESNGPNFEYTQTGDPISLSNNPLRDNITSVTVPPNIYVKVYPNEECIGEHVTIIGKYVNAYTSITGDSVETDDINGDVRCSETFEQIPWVDFVNGCTDGSITGDMCGRYQPIDPGGGGGNPPDIVPIYDDRLWIQIIGAILLAIVLILVGIAYYKAWKRYRATKTLETARISNQLPDPLLTNSKGGNAPTSNVANGYSNNRPPMNQQSSLRQDPFESSSLRFPTNQRVNPNLVEDIGVDIPFQAESIGPLVPIADPMTSPRANLRTYYGQQRPPMNQQSSLRQDPFESSSLRFPTNREVNTKPGEDTGVDIGFQRGPMGLRSTSSSLNTPRKFPPSSGIRSTSSLNMTPSLTVSRSPSAPEFEDFSSFTGL
jgi:hypothetical protein